MRITIVVFTERDASHLKKRRTRGCCVYIILTS